MTPVHSAADENSAPSALQRRPSRTAAGGCEESCRSRPRAERCLGAQAPGFSVTARPSYVARGNADGESARPGVGVVYWHHPQRGRVWLSEEIDHGDAREAGNWRGGREAAVSGDELVGVRPGVGQPGYLTIRFDDASIWEQWTRLPPERHGEPGLYSQTAIQTCLRSRGCSSGRTARRKR